MTGTVIGSDFDYKDQEFTSQAVANRRFRRRRITPFMKWEFAKDMLRLMTNIRNMRSSIANNPPQSPSTAVLNRNKQQIEESRLRVIEIENHQMLERLRKIHNRPRSYFCHLKKRGVPLIKGDAFRLHPPTGRRLYILQIYKRLKLANPLSARKSIRVQQEMLTSAIDMVRQSKKNKPSEELINGVVQLTLATVDESPSQDGVSSDGGFEDQKLSPAELVKLAKPNSDVDVTYDYEGLTSAVTEVAGTSANEAGPSLTMPQW